MSRMRIVALITVHNEERTLGRLLAHHHAHGIETCVVDHGSTDGTMDIVRSFVGRGVMRVASMPFDGVFSLDAQLHLKEQLAAEIDADWFIHCDADEIREPHPPFQTLREGIEHVAAAGYDAIDFDEFVFLPTRDAPRFEGRDFVAEMRSYYYYEPTSPDRFRINAWKRQPSVDLRSFAGHKVLFPGQRLYPRAFILRHYIVLSREHAIEKYAHRRFDAGERARGWHGDRASFRAETCELPLASELSLLGPDGIPDASRPRAVHPLFMPRARPAEGGAQVPPRLRAYLASQAPHVRGLASVAQGPRPFWSIAIPTYEPEPAWLEETLRCALSGDGGPTEREVLVLDDASSRVDVGAIVQRVGGGRVVFRRNGENLGLVGNWNACLAATRGEWIHLLHQDDRVAPDFYALLGSACQREPAIVAAFCRGGGLDADGQTTWLQDLERDTPGVLPDFAARSLAANRVLTPAIVYRRAALEAVGAFHDDLPYCADWELTLRLSALGPIWYEPRTCAYWRQHDGSQSARLQKTGADLRDRRRVIALAHELLDEEVVARSQAGAIKSSLLWAIDVLREHVREGRLPEALAQAREIGSLLAASVAANGESAAEASSVAAARSDRGTVAALDLDVVESRLQAWMRAASILAERRATSL